MPNLLLRQALKVVGVFAVLTGLIAPQVHAESAKRVTDKKQKVTKTIKAPQVATTGKSVKTGSAAKTGIVVKTARTAKTAKPASSAKAGKTTALVTTDKLAKTNKFAKANKFVKLRNETKSKKMVVAGKRVRVFAVGARQVSVVAAVPAKVSFAQSAGLHGAQDALELRSSVALVVDQDTQEVLFSKNDQVILPIASLTKLMMGVVVSGSRLPMDELIMVTQDDVDTEKGSRSRLSVGTELTRGELLHLALMSSENRAAHALGRTHPGGMASFVSLMNAKAKLLGMKDTIYVEPTGLSSRNQSSARDLATLVNAAHGDAVLRELSTSTGYQVAVGSRTLQFNNTNRLVKNPDWDIGLQKTGYISEAGQCLVMQTKIAGRKLIMVFLDSAGKLSRLGDAERVRRWVESTPQADQKINISVSAKPTAG